MCRHKSIQDIGSIHNNTFLHKEVMMRSTTRENNNKIKLKKGGKEKDMKPF